MLYILWHILETGKTKKNFLLGISDTVYTDGVDTVFAVFCILVENGYPVLQIEVIHLLKHHNSKES